MRVGVEKGSRILVKGLYVSALIFDCTFRPLLILNFLQNYRVPFLWTEDLKPLMHTLFLMLLSSHYYTLIPFLPLKSPHPSQLF